MPKTAFTLPFENMSTSKYVLDSHKHQLTSRNSRHVSERISPLPIAYLDDITIFSRMAEEYLSHIKQVFEKLRRHTLSMKLSKCHFFTKEIQYLRHILSTKCIRPIPSKSKAINYMHPQNQVNKYVHSLDSTDNIGNLLRTLPRWLSH